MAASSVFKVWRRYSKMRRLLMGWMSQATIAAKARTWARSSGVVGNSAGVGWVSSSHSMMAGDWVMTLPSLTKVGTKPCGFKALYSALWCASVRKSTATYSVAKPLRFKAMRKRCEVPERKKL